MSSIVTCYGLQSNKKACLFPPVATYVYYTKYYSAHAPDARPICEPHLHHVIKIGQSVGVTAEVRALPGMSSDDFKAWAVLYFIKYKISILPA